MLGSTLGALHPFYKFAWVEGCEAALDLGDLEQVEELLGEVERLRPSERTPFLTAHEARFRGRLLAARGDRDDAAELLGRAASSFREIPVPYYLAIALLEQAELGVEESAALVAEARAIFERLGATPWLERVGAAERPLTV